MSGGDSEGLPVTLGQEYRVKLGKSFTFPEKNAFHSLKYDFKPQSVDSRRPGNLRVAEDGAVNVSLPVGQQESGEDYAQFRGPKKMCTKECILIIDRNTGEAILERISDTVQLKAIRDGRKLTIPRDRSVSPSCQPSKPASSHKPLTKTPSSLAPPGTSKPPQALSASKKSKSLQGGQGTPSKILTVPGKMDSGSKAKSSRKRSHNLATALVASGPSGRPSKRPKVGLPEMEMESGLAISPLRSANPTPEPIIPPHLRKAKVFHDSSSSSSSSSSSNSSSSDGEDLNDDKSLVLTGKGSSSLSRPNPSSSSSSLPTKIDSSSRSHHPSSSSSSSHRMSQRSEATPISQTFSGSRLAGSQSLDQAAPSMPSLAHFLDSSSLQLLSKQENTQQQRQSKQQPQKVVAPPPPRLQPPLPLTAHTHVGAFRPQNLPPPPPRQKIEEMSSSSSDSDSSSASSSSASSSSDEENDKEVANAFHQSQQPARQMSMSVLRSDLNLSESGSDSD